VVAATPSYVYAIGRIEPRFPRLSVEKELAQVTGRTETAGLSEPSKGYFLKDRTVIWFANCAG